MSRPADTLALLRAEAEAHLAALRADVAEVVAAASSTTGDDEHDPEGATIGFERAQALSLVARGERRLAELDAALRRVADGSYGHCVQCGTVIAAERLAARPAAATCVRCAASRR